MRTTIKPIARRELADAASWYEKQRKGLGQSFVDRFVEVEASIASSPTSFDPVEPDVRRASMKRFPYSVYYTVEQQRCVIFAIVHDHRDDSIWQVRT